MGDRSDGIPGLPGFGPKAASALIERYGPIEAIPDNPEAWDIPVRGKKQLAEMLRERRNEALLYRNLSTLRLDVPLSDSLEDLEWKGADRPRGADKLSVISTQAH